MSEQLAAADRIAANLVEVGSAEGGWSTEIYLATMVLTNGTPSERRLPGAM